MSNLTKVITAMLFIALSVNAFDKNALKGGNVDKQGIRDFSNQQKNIWLNNPKSIKNNIGKSVGYDESKTKGDIGNVTDINAKQRLIGIMSNFTAKDKRIYKCYEERIVKVKTLYKCSLTNDVFYNTTQCQDKCKKQYECTQANCIQTAQCKTLSGGVVCPIQITQCTASISCPAGGTYNANTGKCEAQPL